MDGWEKILQAGHVEASRAPVAKLLAELDNIPNNITIEDGKECTLHKLYSQLGTGLTRQVAALENTRKKSLGSESKQAFSA